MKRKITAIISLIAILASIVLSAQAQAQAQDTPEIITDVADGWARLYDDKNFGDRVLTVEGEHDIKNLKNVKSDNGKKGFNDKTSSVKFQIPKGWKLVLFDDHDYKDSIYELKGTGKVVEIGDLGSFSDKVSSLRWERDPQ